MTWRRRICILFTCLMDKETGNYVKGEKKGNLQGLESRKNIFKFIPERKRFKMEIKNPSTPFIFQKDSIRSGLFYSLFLDKVKFSKKGVDKMSSLLSSCLTEDVGRAEEENLGEIHRHVQVMVHKRGILLGICQMERVTVNT